MQKKGHLFSLFITFCFSFALLAGLAALNTKAALQPTEFELYHDPLSSPAITETGVALENCDTYYLHADTINVGAGVNGGVQMIASTAAPTGTTATNSVTLTTGGFQEIARFYTDPVLAGDLAFAADIDGLIWVNIAGGTAKGRFQIELLDYDPVGGGTTPLGTFTSNALLPSGVDTQVAFSITKPVTSIPAGHRLLLILSGLKQGGGSGPQAGLLFDSPSRDSQFSVCQPTPPILSISKTGSASAIAGQPITYTLSLTNSGELTATNLIISDTLPTGATYVSGGTLVSGTLIGRVVRWTLPFLAPQATAQVVFTVTASASITNTDYQVTAGGNVQATGQNTVFTSVSQPGQPNLLISKDGPATAIAGDLIVYELTVANGGDTTAFSLIVSDTMPSGANYVSGGVLVGNVVRWSGLPPLLPNTDLKVSFTVTATTSIVNSDYRVSAAGNALATGQKSVTTVIGAPPLLATYLPLVLKAGPQALLLIESVNTGGINPVEVRQPSTNALLLSCVIGDNITQTCGSFPAIGTYKLVAYTANCGVLEGTFSDATPGATITRRVFCN